MNDGDQSLVVGDDLFVEIAERNMDGIVPLYYKMEESTSNKISKDSIYASMTNAYSGGNIGAVSNNITKIWNSDEPNLDMIKILCLENNFVIDYAKTLYKPTRPPHIKKILSQYTKKKLPYFFMYAKDKKRRQVEARNNSTVNRLRNFIPDDPIIFENTNVGKFDYTMLKSNRNHTLESLETELIEKYHKLDLHKYFFINYNSKKENNLTYIYEDIAKELTLVSRNTTDVTDELTEYLYHHKNSNYKTTLWESFGDVLIKNLKKNIDKPLDDGWIMCEICGERVKKESPTTKFCEKCWFEHRKSYDRERKRRLRG